MKGKAIWTGTIRISAVFHSLRVNIRRETCCWVIKWTFLKELPPDNPSGLVAGVRDNWGELFIKNCCYFLVAGEGFGWKGDGLIGWGYGTFSIKRLEHTPQAWRVTFVWTRLNGLDPFFVDLRFWCCGGFVRWVFVSVGQYGERSYFDVGRGGVPTRGDMGRRVIVKENEVGVCQGSCD